MKKPKINGLEKLSIKQLENLIKYIKKYKEQKKWLEMAKQVTTDDLANWQELLDKNSKKTNK